MHKAVQTKFRALELPASAAREPDGDDASLLDRAAAPLTTAAACLVGVLLFALIPWLWTAAAWASGMRPEALAVVVLVAAVASAVGAMLATAASTAHPSGALVATALLFAASLARLPLAADALTAAPGASATAVSLAASIAALAGLPIATLAASVTLLHRQGGTRAIRRAAAGGTAMLLLYPISIEPAYLPATQAGLWMASFVLVAMLTLVALARDGARPAPPAARGATPSTMLALLHAAIPAAVLPPLLTDVGGAFAPLALPGSVILVATLVPALLTRSARPTSHPSTPSPSLLVMAGLALLVVVMPAASPFRLLVAVAALILATSLHVRAMLRPEPHLVATGVALGMIVGSLLTRIPLPWPPLSLALMAAVATCPEMHPDRLDARTVRRTAATALIAIAAALLASALVRPFALPARLALALACVPAALFIVHRTRFWPERNIVCLIAALAAAPIVPTSWRSVDVIATAWSPLRKIERLDGSVRHILAANARIAREPSAVPTRLVDAVDVVRRIKQDEFESEPAAPQPLLIGAVGGAGASVCVARSNDVVRVFEADPAIAAISADRRWPTSLSRCATAARIVAGDPRRTLSREPDEAFDVLLLAASAFPAPPLHLLTSDVLAVMIAKLSPTGILALDTGHDRLDLSTWLARELADVRGVQAARVGRDLLLVTRSAAVAGEIAAWPETNGLERLSRPAVPHHFDLVPAVLDRRATPGL